MNPLVLAVSAVAGFLGGFFASRRSVGVKGVKFSYEDLVALLEGLGVDPDVAKAVMKVESGGRAAIAGRMTIRFESHVFKARTGAVVLLPGMAGPNDGRNRRGGQADEYEALGRATSIDSEKAYQSISMGLFQIMGFNFADAGYSSAAEMFERLGTGPDEQYASFGRFVQQYRNGGLLRAMRLKDWPTFGQLYNGTASAGPIYERAYNAVRAVA